MGVAKVVASALLGDGVEDELAVTRTLAVAPNLELELSKRLVKAELCDKLASTLAPELQALCRVRAATGAELHSKFMQDGDAFTLKYGDLNTFFGGLAAKIGAPSPRIRHAMEREHVHSADSQDTFATSNYGVSTTPEVEWQFVTAPETRGAEEWPLETMMRDALTRRRPLPLAELAASLDKINQKLAILDEPLLLLEEAMGGRLYTGPMFVKYNDLLRGFGNALEGCKGNGYVTTTHVINSVIVKVSKLTVAAKVFRGISGGVLPDSFWQPNAQNVRGGIESAFLSTTLDRSVALAYSQEPGRAGLLFEIQMGMIDRGADISWLSQYPHEAEILFAPLSGLEVQGTRAEGSTLVVEARLSVNLASLTIEQVVSKRRALLCEIAQNTSVELRTALKKTAGVHEGKTCLVSGVSPILGTRYQHPTTPGLDLCEAEWRKLPPEGDDPTVVETLMLFTGESFTQSDFQPVTALSESEIEARVGLAAAAMSSVTSFDAEWFNDDTNYESAVTVPLRVLRQLTPMLPPPILRVFGLGVEEALEQVHNGTLDALELLQAVDMDAYGQGIPSSKRLQCVDVGVDVTRAELLNRFADGTSITLVGRRSRSRVPEGVGCLRYLETLDLSLCKRLERLPEAVCDCLHLVTLDVRGGDALRALPEAIGQLTELRSLSIHDCMLVERLPDGLCDLTSLRVLNLSMSAPTAEKTGMLSTLPDAFGRLTSLQELKLQNCCLLSSLPDSTCDLASLKALSFMGCYSLVALPREFGRLRSLEKLELQCCHSLVELPPSFGQLTALRSLSFAGMEMGTEMTTDAQFNSACSSLARLPDLSHLTPQLQVTGVPAHLQGWEAGGRKALQAFDLIPGGGGAADLSSVSELGVGRAHDDYFEEVLMRCVDGVGTTALRTLYIATGREQLPAECLEPLRGSLHRLHFLSCSHLRVLPESVTGCTQLTELRLYCCVELASLPTELGALVSLRTLVLHRCENLAALPASIGALTQLVRFDLHRCKSLQAMPESLVHMSALEELDLSDCRNLVALPSTLMGLNRLKELRMMGCERLETLPSDLQGLPALSSLDVRLCALLDDKSVPEPRRNEAGLEVKKFPKTREEYGSLRRDELERDAPLPDNSLSVS